MEMSRTEILQFNIGIVAAQNQHDKYDEYFTYSLSRNKRAQKDIVETIQEGQKKILEKYNDELRVLSEKLCDRENGKPYSENGQYRFIENGIRYTNEKKILDEKYKPDIDRNKAFMAEKDNVDVYIHKHQFPALHGDIADFLFPMREEPKEIK